MCFGLVCFFATVVTYFLCRKTQRRALDGKRSLRTAPWVYFHFGFCFCFPMISRGFSLHPHSCLFLVTEARSLLLSLLSGWAWAAFGFLVTQCLALQCCSDGLSVHPYLAPFMAVPTLNLARAPRSSFLLQWGQSCRAGIPLDSLPLNPQAFTVPACSLRLRWKGLFPRRGPTPTPFFCLCHLSASLLHPFSHPLLFQILPLLSLFCGLCTRFSALIPSPRPCFHSCQRADGAVCLWCVSSLLQCCVPCPAHWWPYPPTPSA